MKKLKCDVLIIESHCDIYAGRYAADAYRRSNQLSYRYGCHYGNKTDRELNTNSLFSACSQKYAN